MTTGERTRAFHAIVGILAALMLLATHLQKSWAQMGPMEFQLHLMLQTQTWLMDYAAIESLKQKEIARIQQGYVTRGRKIIAAGKATSRFKPSRTSLTADLLAKRFGKSPGHQRQIKAEVHQALDSYETLTPQYNLDPTDLADTLSSNIAAKYELYQYNGTKEFSLKHLAILQKRVRAQALSDPELQGLANHEKQRVHEVLVVDTAVLAALHREAMSTGDAVLDEQVRETARQGFTDLMGVPPNQVKFTSTALIIKK